MKMNCKKLIEFVRINPCLYDKRDPKYKDFKYKELIWAEIADAIEISVKECKTKWKSMRDKFRRLKVAEICPSSSATKTGAPWKYFDYLEFLNDPLETIGKNGNIEDDLMNEDLQCDDSMVGMCDVKRSNDEMITEILQAMKKKYETSAQDFETDKYSSFFDMVRQRLDRLPEEEIDNVQIEILQLLHKRLRAYNN